jgi:hypothetical protein
MIYRTLLMAILVAQVGYEPASAQKGLPGNPTLQKVLDAYSPSADAGTLSAIFVRTEYAPQTIGGPPSETASTVQRTVISEVLADARNVKESVVAAYKADGSVKQYAFHYSNDGETTKVYDSRNATGHVRRSSGSTANPLGLVLHPHAAVHSGRFISRAIPALMDRLSGATITSEDYSVAPEGDRIVLEGEYSEPSPQHHFMAVVDPALNYAVIDLVEYDKNGNALSEMSAGGFRNIGTDSVPMWVPVHMTVKVYKYDDYEGNTVKMHTLEILDPKLVTSCHEDFAIVFPRDARKVYDATADLDVTQARAEVSRLLADRIGDLDRGQGQRPSTEPLSDRTGDSLVSRAKEAYVTDRSALMNWMHQTPSSGPANLEAPTLRLPSPDPHSIAMPVIGVALAILLGAVGFALWYRMRARAHTKVPPGSCSRPGATMNAFGEEVNTP